LIAFSSDSREPSDVVVTMSDRPQKSKPINWRAHVIASDLQAFAFRFIDLLETYEREGSLGNLSADND